VRHGSAHRIEGLGADHQVDVRAVRTQRLVARQAKVDICLTPPVLVGNTSVRMRVKPAQSF
jgi:hypothetical protein